MYKTFVLLISLMMNLSMFGPPTPPIPPTPHGGGEGGHFRDEKSDSEDAWRKRLKKDDEEIIPILAGWFIEQQNKN